MSYTYAVLGAGRQGTAAGYDMARRGEAGRVIVADQKLETARCAAERINRLLGRPVAEAIEVDVTNADALAAVLRGVTSVLGAVPYYYDLGISRVAIQVGARMCDLGGNTDIVRQRLCT